MNPCLNGLLLLGLGLIPLLLETEIVEGGHSHESKGRYSDRSITDGLSALRRRKIACSDKQGREVGYWLTEEPKS